jgi:uncharacterized membrane protein YcaP (DUF421 family)
MHRGQFLASALRRSRVRKDEVWAAIRGAGVANDDEVEAVVLETDGSFSVVRTGGGGGRSSLSNIATDGAEHEAPHTLGV